MTKVPHYVDLPMVRNGLRGHQETRDEPRGTLSFASPKSIVAAARGVAQGVVVPLMLETNELEVRTRALLASGNARVSVSDNTVAFAGTRHWARFGAAGRGILLDLTGPFGTPVSDRDFRTAIENSAADIRPGDAIFLHTGWLDGFLEDPANPPPPRWLAANESTAEFIWDAGICAVCTDLPLTERPCDGSFRRPLSDALGLAELDLLCVARVAEACKARRIQDFLFTANPVTGRAHDFYPAEVSAIL